MTDLAKASFGAQLSIGAYSATPTYQAIGEIESINLPELMRDVINATTHDSANGASQYIAEGVFDVGVIKGTLNYLPTGTAQAAIAAAIRSGAKQSIKIVFDGLQWTGSGYVTKFAPDAFQTKGKKTAQFEMKPNADFTVAAV